MRVCLIAEKPSLAQVVIPVIAAMHPELDPDGFACAYVNPHIHLNSRFRYPRGLSHHDYPFIGEPAYEPFAFGSADTKLASAFSPRFGFTVEASRSEPWPAPHATWTRTGPCPADPHAEASRRLQEADIVYAAVDPGPTSTLALDRCLAALGLRNARVAIPRLLSLGSDYMRSAFAAAGRPGEPWYEENLARARVRRRFDYAYQVNALAVHGRAMRLAGARRGADVPSKYGLQLLYDLARGRPRSEGCILADMDLWKGTGRYRDLRTAWGGTPSLGSPASRHVILRSLVVAGLAESLPGDQARISQLGLRLLSLLHPNSEDRDLPFRLHEWQSDPQGNAKVDRYIRTFFGRQIRFQARRAALDTGLTLT